MAWEQTTKQDLLENIQQNLIMPFHTVHDEIDIMIPNYLAEGVTAKLAYIATCKDVVDRLGSGYINYLADCEMDRKNFSWIPRGADSLNPYAMPHNRQEKYAKDAMVEATIKPEVVEVKTDMPIKDFRQSIKYDSKGVYVKLITPSKEVVSSKPISKESLKPYIKDSNGIS